jgi:hypothetical protein
MLDGKMQGVFRSCVKSLRIPLPDDETKQIGWRLWCDAIRFGDTLDQFINRVDAELTKIVAVRGSRYHSPCTAWGYLH